MSPRQVRKAERAAHLFWAAVLVVYVYGPQTSWLQPVVRWVVIPAMTASGLAMWFAARLRRLASARLSRPPVPVSGPTRP